MFIIGCFCFYCLLSLFKHSVLQKSHFSVIITNWVKKMSNKILVTNKLGIFDVAL